MKKVIILLSAATLFYSCGVQQFPVNTKVEPLANVGKVLGEKTKKLKKGEDYTKSGTVFLIGINIISDCDTYLMAKKINAENYTIETKSNFLSILFSVFTSGFVDYKVINVKKRVG